MLILYSMAVLMFIIIIILFCWVIERLCIAVYCNDITDQVLPAGRRITKSTVLRCCGSGEFQCQIHITPYDVPVGPGFYHLKNRVLMGSMHTGLEERPNGFERMAAYFAERARGGVGLLLPVV